MTPTQEKNRRWAEMFAIVFVFLLAACGEKKPEPTGEPASTPAPELSGEPTAAPSPAGGRGSISGEVIFKGKAAASTLTINKDQEVCGKTKTEPGLIVSAQGKLHNVVVSIAAAGDAKATPTKVVLDQKGCEYNPHVLAFPAGSTVEILNPDGILHNVHTYSKNNSPINLAQPKFKKTMTVTFDKPEIIEVKCDVHSWMNGWLFVAGTPYFAVTDGNGSFQISDLPAGEHVVEIWHEQLGKQSKKVKIGANESASVNFEFSAPGA